MTYIWPKASPALFSTVHGILLTSVWEAGMASGNVAGGSAIQQP